MSNAFAAHLEQGRSIRYLLLILTLAGYAGTFNFYVRSTGTKKQAFQSKIFSLAKPILFVNKIRIICREALNHWGNLTHGLGNALIFLTGIVRYQGISGVNTHAIAATSPHCALLLGAAVYVHGVPWQTDYAESAATIIRTIGLVAPLHIRSKQTKPLNKTLKNSFWHTRDHIAREQRTSNDTFVPNRKHVHRRAPCARSNLYSRRPPCHHLR